jgi:hypothetical protein
MSLLFDLIFIYIIIIIIFILFLFLFFFGGEVIFLKSYKEYAEFQAFFFCLKFTAYQNLMSGSFSWGLNTVIYKFELH